MFHARHDWRDTLLAVPSFAFGKVRHCTRPTDWRLAAPRVERDAIIVDSGAQNRRDLVRREAASAAAPGWAANQPGRPVWHDEIRLAAIAWHTMTFETHSVHEPIDQTTPHAMALECTGHAHFTLPEKAPAQAGG